MLDVEVEEGGLGAEDEDVGEPLVLGVPDHVGEVVRSGHAAELRGARPGAPAQDQQQGDHDADQDAPQEAGAEDAEERGDGHAELAPLEPPQAPEVGQLEEPAHRHEHDGREHGLRQVAQERGEEEGDHGHDARRHEAREGRAGAAPLVHQRLRHAAAHREAVPEAGGQVAAGQREELLVAVEAVAVLAGEHPPDRGGLHRAEQEARHGQGQEQVHVGGADRGQAGHRQALRHLAEEGHPAARQAEEGHGGDAGHEDEERHRAVGQQPLAEDEQAQRRRAEREGRGVRLPEVREDVPHPLPEVAVAALEPEELGQLRAGEVQGHPGLEAGHDRLGDEVHEAPRAQQPGHEAERGDEERGGRGERGVARARRPRRGPRATCRRGARSRRSP